RVFEVLLVAGVLTSWRRLDLGSAAGLGFRRHAWARELARGLAIGFAGLAVGLSVAALFGGLVPALRFSPGKTVRKALLGAGAAGPATRRAGPRVGLPAAWVEASGAGGLLPGIGRPAAWLVGTGWPPLVGGVAGWIAVGVAAALLARRRLMFR